MEKYREIAQALQDDIAAANELLAEYQIVAEEAQQLYDDYARTMDGIVYAIKNAYSQIPFSAPVKQGYHRFILLTGLEELRPRLLGEPATPPL